MKNIPPSRPVFWKTAVLSVTSAIFAHYINPAPALPRHTHTHTHKSCSSSGQHELIPWSVFHEQLTAVIKLVRNHRLGPNATIWSSQDIITTYIPTQPVNSISYMYRIFFETDSVFIFSQLSHVVCSLYRHCSVRATYPAHLRPPVLDNLCNVQKYKL